jgi:hypothetical protein
MTADPFASFTWQLYPDDVPTSRRLPCSVCGRLGEVIRYRHEQFGALGSPLANPNGPPSEDVRAMITVFCLDDAHKAGYGTYKDRGDLPPHLNHIQRWIAHALDHGDPEHLD